jgi:GDP-L-fucose synthase
MENLLVAAKPCKKLINFGSGAEFDIAKDIYLQSESAIDDIVPLEYGGFQKRIITKRLLATTNPECFNLRFFGGFGPLELEDRFIKSNLLNIIHNKPIVIHKNRWFDFIYIDDLALITKTVIEKQDLPHDINCVYLEKTTLLDVAQLLLSETNSSVDIVIKDSGTDLSFMGNGQLLSTLNLPLKGLRTGILEMYQRLKTERSNVR